MGGHRDTGDLQHHAPAGEGVRKRGDRAGVVLPERRAVRDLVQGQARQVPGSVGSDVAEALRFMADSVLSRIPVVGGVAYIERVRRLPAAFTATLAPEP